MHHNAPSPLKSVSSASCIAWILVFPAPRPPPYRPGMGVSTWTPLASGEGLPPPCGPDTGQ